MVDLCDQKMTRRLSNIHSFFLSFFTNHFILFRVALDPEPIPKTLGTMYENSPWMGCQSLEQPIHLLEWFGRLEEAGEPEGNPEHRGEHEKLHTEKNLTSVLNLGPKAVRQQSFIQATYLIVHTLYKRLKINK